MKRNLFKTTLYKITSIVLMFGVFFAGNPSMVLAQFENVVPVADSEAKQAVIDQGQKSRDALEKVTGFSSTQLINTFGALDIRLKAALTKTYTSMVFDKNSNPIDNPGIATDAEECKQAIQDVGAGVDANTLGLIKPKDPGFWTRIIGGGQAEAVQNSEQVQKYYFLSVCFNTYLDNINDRNLVPVFNLYEAQQISDHTARFVNAIKILSDKISTLSSRASAGWKDSAKAAMLKAIMSVNQNVTTNLINRAINKYKISDYLKYADAVATQIYSMKYIDQNYQGDEERKMVLRSILANEGTQQASSLLQISAEKKARDFLNKVCDPAKGAYDYGTLQYIKCMAIQASDEVSPVEQSNRILEEAARAKLEGQKAASQEIADGKGYAPVRNCNGSVSQQEIIDNEWGQAAIDLDVAKKTLETLQNSVLSTGTGNLTAEQKAQLGAEMNAEIQKAQDAVNKAQADYDAVKSKRVTGNIVDICEAIASPGTFIANSIDSFLKQHLDQSTQLKSENLPFFFNFFSKVASNFLTKLIVGAFDGSNKQHVIKESGVSMLTGATAASASEIQNLVSSENMNAEQESPTLVSGTNGNVDIYAYPTGGSSGIKLLNLEAGQNYSLIIDFTELKDAGVASVKISGFDAITGESSAIDKIPLNSEQISSGKIMTEFNATGGFSLTADFYADTTGDNPTSTKLGSYTQTFYVAKTYATPGVLPRGETTSETTQSGGAQSGMGTQGEGLGQSSTGEAGSGEGSLIKGASIILPRGPSLSPRG